MKVGREALGYDSDWFCPLLIVVDIRIELLAVNCEALVEIVRCLPQLVIGSEDAV